MWALTSQQLELKGTPLRVGSAFLLAGAVILPLLPAHEGIICPLRLTTGIPCPLCGMTTSVTAAGRGRVAEAVAANPAGLAALAAALVILIVRPRDLRIPVWSIAAVLGAMWIFELARFSVL